MAYGMVFNILSATYHVLKVLHVLCMYKSDYLEVFRNSNNDEGASLRWEIAFEIKFNILSVTYHVLNVLNVVYYV